MKVNFKSIDLQYRTDKIDIELHEAVKEVIVNCADEMSTVHPFELLSRYTTLTNNLGIL